MVIKPLVRRQAQGLNPNRHTTQEAHNVPWIGARDLNTVPWLATLGGAPLCQCGCYIDDFANFLANAHFSVWNRPISIYGSGAEYLLTRQVRIWHQQMIPLAYFFCAVRYRLYNTIVVSVHKLSEKKIERK